MEESLVTTWVLTIILRVLWILVVPIIVIIAACKLWHHTPRWIPIVLLLSAIVDIVTSVPSVLIHLHLLSVVQYGELAAPVAISSGGARICFVLAVLALAIRMKRMTEQSPGGDSIKATPQDRRRKGTGRN